MQVSQVDFSAIAFSPFVATKGVKTSQATLNGAPVEFLLSNDEWFPAPFGASAFNDEKATRLTLELDVSRSPVLEVLGLAEQAIITKAHAAGIFESQSLEDVTKTFKSSVAYSEKYTAFRWRTKLNTVGFKPCRFFLAPDKTRVQYDDLDLRQSTVRPHVCFKGLWKQGGQWGLQFEVLNLLVQPASDAPDPF